MCLMPQTYCYVSLFITHSRKLPGTARITSSPPTRSFSRFYNRPFAYYSYYYYYRAPSTYMNSAQASRSNDLSTANVVSVIGRLRLCSAHGCSFTTLRSGRLFSTSFVPTHNFPILHTGMRHY